MINTYRINLTNLQQELLRFLFIHPEQKFNARRLSQKLEVSPPAISKALPLLKKKEYITLHKDKDSKQLSISLNRENSFIIGLKRADNLKQIYETEQDIFLSEKFPGATIILFGSYSTGEDISSSDIDLAIINSKEKEIDLFKFEKILQRKINIQYFGSLTEIHKNLRNNILNGIILSGAVDE
jgi:predicted nucleotidyltransferase